MTIHVNANASGVRTFDNEFLPFNGNGATIGYAMNTSTPTYVEYSGGEYYHGALDSWTYLTTLPLGRKLHLVLEADENRYGTAWPGESRRSSGWNAPGSIGSSAATHRSTSACGASSVRTCRTRSSRFSTTAPRSAQANPYNPGCFVNASNVTLAFHFLAARNEFYVVYGNANDLSTEPALFLEVDTLHRSGKRYVSNFVRAAEVACAELPYRVYPEPPLLRAFAMEGVTLEVQAFRSRFLNEKILKRLHYYPRALEVVLYAQSLLPETVRLEDVAMRCGMRPACFSRFFRRKSASLFRRRSKFSESSAPSKHSSGGIVPSRFLLARADTAAAAALLGPSRKSSERPRPSTGGVY